ncbi:extracellular solute-binding protein [Anaerocolumna sp.]|uniref:extracellular solute-binding protein n=1 Tax=Anaerocolumna sp. TaxID=2041569 RepID=UPI0028A88528|nr:extracellular solute-binding protein [Anaerocolumna sp.]
MNKILKFILVLAITMGSLTGCSFETKNDELYNSKLEEITVHLDKYRESVDELIKSPQNGNNSTQKELATYSSDSALSGTLRISVMWPDNETNLIAVAAKEFQALYPEVKIQIQFHDDVLKYQAQTSVELMSNTAADIIDLSYMPYERYAAAGLLADLYPLMNADDSFHKEDYFVNIFEAFEDSQYGLVVVPLSFIFNSVSMRQDFMKSFDAEFVNRGGISYQQMLDLYVSAQAEMEDENLYMSEYASATGWFEFEWDNLVDTRNKKAYMNTPEFLSNLEKIKRIKLTENVIQTKDGPGVLGGGYFRDKIYKRNPAVLFVLNLSIEEVMQTLLPFNDMIYSKPIPIISDGMPTIYALFVLGITNTCQNKELAWKFLSYCMAERALPVKEVDTNSFFFRLGFPINKQNFRKLVQAVANDTLRKGGGVGYSFSGNRTAAIEESMELVEKWCGMKGRVKQMMDYNLFLDLIYPDLYQYLIGKQTAEQTAARIQTKTEIYLNE